MLKNFLFLVLAVFSLSSCEKMNRYEFNGEAQGTYFKVIYYASQDLELENPVDSILEAVDQSVSLWVDESVIRKVNNNDSLVVPDKIFTDNFLLAERISKTTEGAFDVTVGPVVRAWGFGYSKKRKDMNQQTIDSFLTFVGFDKVVLKDNAIIKADPRLEIDFNAIAQGYTVDLIAEYLKSLGLKNFLVDVGGEVLTKGSKPDGEPWIVGIDKPSENQEMRELQTKVSLYDAAMATSGNYRRYYIQDGMKFSHTIDPATGKPVHHSLLSATVIANSCAEADAFATAFMVMGVEKTKLFLIDHPELEAYLIYDEGGHSRVYHTQGFNKILMD